MDTFFSSRDLLTLFLLIVVSGDVIIITKNDNNSNSNDDEYIRSISRRSVYGKEDNETAKMNCSSVELRTLMREHERLFRAAVRKKALLFTEEGLATGSGELSNEQRIFDAELSKRRVLSTGRLRNCSESLFEKEELSIFTLTGLCHAQCTAYCEDLEDNCKELNCSLYESEAWASNCRKDDVRCLRSCSRNGTHSAEGSQDLVPKTPTAISLIQLSPIDVRVTWSPSTTQSQENGIIYVTEKLSENNNWTVIERSSKNWTDEVVDVCSVVSFRVAAVNQFGYDGYTLPVVRMDLPVPGIITDANNESLSLENDNFTYKFKFYTPENWERAEPKVSVPTKQCPRVRLPMSHRLELTQIEPRTYTYTLNATVDKMYANDLCVNTVHFDLESTCGVRGKSYTKYINLTRGNPLIKPQFNPSSTETNPSSTTAVDEPLTSIEDVNRKNIPDFNRSSREKNSSSTTAVDEPLTSKLSEGNNFVYVSVGIATAVAVLVLLFAVGCVVRRKVLKEKKIDDGSDLELSAIRLQVALHELQFDNTLYKSPDHYTDILGRGDWEISRDLIILGEVLGQGAFGQVRKGTLQLTDRFLISRCHLDEKTDDHQPSQVTVAVKMLIGDHADIYRSDFLREMELMKSIGYHRNVVSMIGCCAMDDPLSLVVEHVAHGDLLNFLQGYRAKSQLQTDDENGFEYLTFWDLMNFAQQIALGMEFLSQNSFVHRDLAARNILVGEEKRVKIGDFGLTRYIYDDQVYVTSRGGKLPLKWMAIESIFDLTFTTASDVWSYGVLLYEVVSLGGTPYPTISHKELLRELQRGYRMERPAVNCSPELYQLMLDCWQTRPKNRPTFTKLRERIETMTDSLKDSPECFTKVVPIYGSAQKNDDSSSGCETDDSKNNNPLNCSPDTSRDFTYSSELSNCLHESSKLDPDTPIHKTHVDNSVC